MDSKTSARGGLSVLDLFCPWRWPWIPGWILSRLAGRLGGAARPIDHIQKISGQQMIEALREATEDHPVEVEIHGKFTVRFPGAKEGR